MVGAVLSTLTAGVVTEALLPAVSVAVAVSVWSLPSPNVWARSWLLMPERESDAVYVAVTSSPYQPLAFGAGSASTLMTGLVLSMLTAAGSVAVLPALSVTVPVTV